jgi:hypothetical protein
MGGRANLELCASIQVQCLADSFALRAHLHKPPKPLPTTLTRLQRIGELF